jgi:tetratricopeptide (TPR) repeat protein
VVAAGGLLGILAVFMVVSGVSSSRRAARARAEMLPPAPAIAHAEPARVPVELTAPAPTPVAVVAAPAAPAAAEPADTDEGSAEEAPAAPEKEPTTRRDGDGTRSSGKGARATAAEERKRLDEGERLLRAERFVEARQIFEKLAHSKRDRGPALVGLAEISFQEKNYAQAVRSAQRAAEKGGGVRARVLLGDAYFRLNHFKEAAHAYEDALKIEPENASAKGGLVLANKRM